MLAFYSLVGYNIYYTMNKGTKMFEKFSDFELAKLAGKYGLQDHLEFNSRLQLSNREHIENIIYKHEYELHFANELAFYSEIEYN